MPSSVGQRLRFQRAAINLFDDKALEFGTDRDIVMQYNGTDFYVEAAADGEKMHIGKYIAASKQLDLQVYGAVAGNYVIWDASADLCQFTNIKLRIEDDTLLTFGSSDDFTVTYNGTNLYLEASTNNDVIHVGHHAAGEKNIDFRLYGSTAGNYFELDASADKINLVGIALNTGALSLEDDEALNLGTGNDFTLTFNGTNLYLEAATNNDVFHIGHHAAGEKNVDLRFYGSTAGNYVELDASANALKLVGIALNTGSLSLEDDEVLNLGTGNDFTLTFNGTNLYLEASTNNDVFHIGHHAASEKNVDLKFYGSTAGNYMELDASADLLSLINIDALINDDKALKFGTGSDFTLSYNGTNLYLEAALTNDVFHIGHHAAGEKNIDLKFYGSTAGNYVELDASADLLQLVNVALRVQDDKAISFGTGDDFTITYNGTNLYIEAALTNDVIHIGHHAASEKNIDLKLYGSTAGNYVELDASADLLQLVNVALRVQDDKAVSFGTGDDFTITYNGTDLYVEASTNNDVIHVGHHAAGEKNVDLRFYGSTAGNYVELDASADALKLVGIALNTGSLSLEDDEVLNLGTGNDFTLTFNGTNLYLEASTNNDIFHIGHHAAGEKNVDLRFYGSTAGNYVELDASANLLSLINIDALINDDKALKFGTGSDFTLSFNGTNLYLEASTNNDVFHIGHHAASEKNIDVRMYGSTAGNYVELDASGNVLNLVNTHLYITSGNELRIGNSSNVLVSYSSPDVRLEAIADNDVFKIGHYADGKKHVDVRMYGSTAANYVELDASGNLLQLVNVALRVQDDKAVSFGTGDDFTVTFNGTNLYIEAATNNDIIHIGHHAASEKNVDVRMYGSTAGNYVVMDASADALIFQDNVACAFGTGSDVTINYDGTDLFITAATNNEIIQIGHDSAGEKNIDVKMYGSTAGNYVELDASANLLSLINVDALINDDKALKFGTGSDFTLSYNGTNLYLEAATNNDIFHIGHNAAGKKNVDLKFYGSTAGNYVELDASGNELNLVNVDLDGAGGFKDTITYFKSNITTNLAAVALDVGVAGNTVAVLPFAGSILGIGLASNDARTAGSCTVEAYVNGAATGFSVVLNSTNTQYVAAAQAKDVDVFGPAQRLELKVTSATNWAPTTADIVATLVVEQ